MNNITLAPFAHRRNVARTHTHAYSLSRTAMPRCTTLHAHTHTDCSGVAGAIWHRPGGPFSPIIANKIAQTAANINKYLQHTVAFVRACVRMFGVRRSAFETASGGSLHVAVRRLNCNRYQRTAECFLCTEHTTRARLIR